MNTLQIKKTIKNLLYTSFIVSAIGLSSSASAWDRGETETFSLLPETSSNPEAIAKDPFNNIYVSTLGSGEIHKYNLDGDLLSSITVTPSSGRLLDLDFHPVNGKLLVIDLGDRKVLEVNPATGDAVTFSDIPGDNALPNVLTFDKAGFVYVSDSIQGIIWRIAPEGGPAEIWLEHELLTTQSYPPFGANGLDFNQEGTLMYIANTGDDTIVQVPVLADGTSGTPTVLANSINAPDGLIVDVDNNILVASFHGNYIMRVNPEGTAINVYGDFDGIDDDGIVKGLLSPSDMITIDGDIYVPNFALDISTFGLPSHVTSFYTELVQRYSIAKIEP